jgi:hypothetical protein
MTKQIRVCNDHQEDEIVPLIWTFAFNGSEYWCPACGFNGGMFGSGEVIEMTKELKKSRKKWSKIGKEFLDAKSTTVCSSLIWEGERISPHDLPDSEKERVSKVIEKWRYKF